MLWCTHLLVEQLSSYSDDSPPRRELYLVAALAGTEPARLFPAAGRPSTRAARQRACAVSPWPLTKRAFVFAALPPPWTGPANSGATASRSGLIAGAGVLPHPGTRGVRVARRSANEDDRVATAVNARSGPHVFDPTALRDARGGRYNTVHPRSRPRPPCSSRGGGRRRYCSPELCAAPGSWWFIPVPPTPSSRTPLLRSGDDSN